jgi:hypothetical protein
LIGVGYVELVTSISLVTATSNSSVPTWKPLTFVTVRPELILNLGDHPQSSGVSLGPVIVAMKVYDDRAVGLGTLRRSPPFTPSLSQGHGGTVGAEGKLGYLPLKESIEDGTL